MSLLQQDYNTSREDLILPEYGRVVQDLAKHIQSIPDKAKRSKLAAGLVSIMQHLNPAVKDQIDGKQKLWDHLHIISNFSLDVDSPFPMPSPESIHAKPEKILYNDTMIRFRFYGRNMQLMAIRAAEMEDGDLKNDFINMIASFMFNSCRNWNNENLTKEALAEHLNILSKGKLVINPEDLAITQDQLQPRKQGNPQQQQQNFRKNNKRNKFNRNKNNFRKY